VIVTEGTPFLESGSAQPKTKYIEMRGESGGVARSDESNTCPGEIVREGDGKGQRREQFLPALMEEVRPSVSARCCDEKEEDAIKAGS